MTDDSALLRSFAAHRRQEDFTELVNRHLGLVYRAALRRTNGDAHLAEDIAQQVFTELARSASSVQHHPVPAGWLYVATRHAASNAMRSERRRREREREAAVVNAPPSPSESEADWEHLRPQLDRVMDELPERDRHAVLLRFFANRPFAEIGEALHLSENAARMHVERVLERLRSALERRGISSTAAALAALLADQAATAAPAGLASSVTSSALAGAATAGTTIPLYLISLMSTTKATLGIAGVIICIAVGTAVYEANVARKAQAALEISVQNCARLRRETARLAANAKAANARAEIEKAENRPLARARAANQGGGRTTVPSPAELAANDPAFRRLYLENQRISNAVRYRQLFTKLEKLGISAQQISDFQDALLLTVQGAIDAAVMAKAQGLQPNDPAVVSITSSAWKESTNAISRALGANGIAEYRAYQREGNARSSVDALATQLYYTDTPLTASQADRLKGLIIANTDHNRPIGFQTDWDNVISQARDALSPGQIKALSLTSRHQLLQAQQGRILYKLSFPDASPTD